METMRHLLLGAALLGATALASAHDSWFERLPPSTAAPGASALLALGTGNQFPRYESGIDAKYLASQGCRSADGNAPMRAQRDLPAALLLATPAGAQTCWAQLTPFQVTLDPDKIDLYLREVGASAELRASWAALQARGLPWIERYTKHARIALAGDGALGAEPVPMAMDVLLDGPAAQGIRAGQPLAFRVLRDGAPLAGMPVELRHANSRFGIWRRTDDAGRVELPALPPGRWLLRGVDLRLSSTVPDTWDSRFITLAFEVPR